MNELLYEEPYVKLFSYYTEKNQIRIGIEMKGKLYNFTQMFEFFKDMTGVPKSPELVFLQMMIELGIFNKADILEIFNTVSNMRPLDDIQLPNDIRYDVPISRPTKILCIGRNYLKHAEETGHDAPSEPMFFAKMPSAMSPHLGSIVLPEGVGRVDHEGELALVISKEGKNIAESKAFDYVAGYTVANDVTARALQKSDTSIGHPWTRAKGFDTFLPIGPYLVPAGLIGDVQDLDISVKVNGEYRQRSSTSKMIFQIPRLIAHISKHMTLMTGDIICTGTPEGISELHEDDIVEVEVQELGKLISRVTAAK